MTQEYSIGSIEMIDCMYQEMEPFVQSPEEEYNEQVEDFMEFMDFHPGTLHKSFKSIPWLHGQVEDPEWLGEAQTTFLHSANKELYFSTNPDEPFLVIGHVLLKAINSGATGHNDESYFYALKVMVRDKVGYFPLPIAQMDENGANHFKELFTQVVPD